MTQATPSPDRPAAARIAGEAEDRSMADGEQVKVEAPEPER